MSAAGRSTTPISGAAGADTSGGAGASADAEASVPAGPLPDLVLDAAYLVDGRGCADNYGSELQCQWVDITDVTAGAYCCG